MTIQMHVLFFITHKQSEYREVWRLVQEGMFESANYSGLLILKTLAVLSRNVINASG